MSTLGDNILRKRKELGMTQEELADRMGYKSKSSINKIELGLNDVPRSKIEKFAEVLGTTPARLMGLPSLKIGARANHTIGKNIRSFRNKANMSQKELADLLGVEESFIVNLEAGKCTLTKEQTFRICDIFHTTPNFINGTITELLEDGDLDAEYRLSNQASPDQLKLTEGEQTLLELFRLVPEENQRMVLEMIRAAVKTQG